MKSMLVIAALAVPATAAPLRAVKFSMFGVCAIGADAKILCDKASSLPVLDVPARDLVSTYAPLVVRTDGILVRIRNGLDGPAKPEPIDVGFKVRAAGTVGTGKTSELCVLGEAGELACGAFDHDVGTKLDAKPAPGRFVDAQFDEEVLWALDDRGALWCAGGLDCARLSHASRAKPKASLLELASAWPTLESVADAPLWRVTGGVKHIYATGSPCFELADRPGSLVCMSFADGPKVVARPKGDEILTAGASLCARTGERITCALALSDKPAKPETMVVKGAARMHSGGSSFCVEDAHGALACAKIGNPMPPLAPVVWAARPSH